jgi:hypothetical protein
MMRSHGKTATHIAALVETCGDLMPQECERWEHRVLIVRRNNGRDTPMSRPV